MPPKRSRQKTLRRGGRAAAAQLARDKEEAARPGGAALEAERRPRVTRAYCRPEKNAN